MKQVTKNVFVETEWPGANVGFVVTSAGVVMIDTTGDPSNAMVWKREVESRGPIKYLINTEAHWDHYFGNCFFNAPVVAHEKAREVIVSTGLKQVVDAIAMIDPAAVPSVKDSKLNMPSITFSEQLTLYVGEHTFELIHFGGHSPGLIAVLVPEERVVFAGDNVHNKVQPFMHDADPYEWIDAIDIISAMDVDYIVPGHGACSDKSILKDEFDFVQSCIDKIKAAIKKGWSKEETLARVSFEQYPLDAGMGAYGKFLLDSSITHMYEFLSKKKR